MGDIQYTHYANKNTVIETDFTYQAYKQEED